MEKAASADGSAGEPARNGRPFMVVGIGASAGGLEALRGLLENLSPGTGMAFVYVQHLMPGRESMLSEILSKWTSMPVVEVGRPMPVKPDCLYVMPPNFNLSITRGILKPVRRDQRHTRYSPIDEFFQALSSDQGSRAAGVVLSGNASDGSQGLASIKAAGGITFAQSPGSAKFDSMPRSASNASTVDFVMPPEKIARELVKISRHPYLRAPQPGMLEKAPPAKPEHYHKIFAILKQATGTDFTYYKKPTINRRVLRRMLLHKIDGIERYARFLHDNRKEIDALYQDLLINVTGFFRDPPVYEALKQKVFPPLFKGRPMDQPFRAWVTACSTGEEAYSIAMALVEYLGDKAAGISLQVFATDLNEAAIEKARKGFYKPGIAQGLSPERLRRFFTRGDNGYQINKSIRDMCIFARQNLFKDPPFSNIDLITCRNLLIYLEPVLQKKIFHTFHYALRSGGHLLLGASESPGPFSDLFSLVDKKQKIYLKKNLPSRLALPLPSPAEDRAKGKAGPDKKGAGPLESPLAHDILREADRLILSRYSPAGVVVNEDMEILQFRGPADDYLRHHPGSAGLNLVRMVHKDLSMDLRGAVYKVKKKGGPVRLSGVVLKSKGSSRVDITVMPLKDTPRGEKNYLILFERAGRAAKEGPGKAGKGRLSGRERRKFSDLKRELQVAKEYLQSIIEQQESTNQELRSANEEILSNNEELQSTNEELETAKEELQSTNEELTTVNEELQNRNVELGKLYDDFNNLLKNINVAIVIVGKDLRIRKFTTGAEKTFNLILSDVGRPISDISPNVKILELTGMIRAVVDTLAVKEVEVQDREGHWYLLQVKPYQTMENRIEGAVLVLVDIDVLKRTMGQLSHNDEFAKGIVDTVRDALLILDPRFRVRMCNRPFSVIFRIPPSEVENRMLFEMDGGNWDIPELRDLCQRVGTKNVFIQDHKVEHEFPRVGRKKLLLNLRPILGQEGQLLMILLSMADITGEKENRPPVQLNPLGVN